MVATVLLVGCGAGTGGGITALAVPTTGSPVATTTTPTTSPATSLPATTTSSTSTEPATVPPRTTTTLVIPSSAPEAPVTTLAPVPRPTGNVTAAVTSVTATQSNDTNNQGNAQAIQQMGDAGPAFIKAQEAQMYWDWVVNVTGTVTNGANAAVNVLGVIVSVPWASPGEVRGFQLRPETTVPWQISEVAAVLGLTKPATATLTAPVWGWVALVDAPCPT